MCKIIPGPQQMIQVPSAEIEPRDVTLRNNNASPRSPNRAVLPTLHHGSKRGLSFLWTIYTTPTRNTALAGLHILKTQLGESRVLRNKTL
ncbi:hypothetical protein CFP56_004998 [Quercus suber]|uniref:Uncharacterized protein n=1 Tax=Quercus suber TaxID=58331 RepID=A0AAW0L9N7_QUESU